MKSNSRIPAVKKEMFGVLSALLIVGSATAVFAATGEEHHVDTGALVKDFLYRILNFAVLFGILAYFVTKPIRKGLAGRRGEIEKRLNESESARREAEAKFAEYDRKLSQASAEIDEIHTSIRREGELERERILANSREMAEKIKKEAEKTAANEVAKARMELRREASRMAVEIAENILRTRITPEDQARLVEEYTKKVGDLH